jgi:hypothetical protein
MPRDGPVLLGGMALVAVRHGVPARSCQGLLRRRISSFSVAAKIFWDRARAIGKSDPPHCLCVLAVLGHAQRYRLHALQDQKRIERRYRGADISQKRDTGLDDIGDRQERLNRSVHTAP